MSDLITPTARLLAPSGLSREEWLEVRRTGVGGSDVAAILGMDRRRGPLHVYLDKRGEGPGERRGPRLDRSARRGHRLEGLIAEFFAEETGHAVVEAPGTLQNAERPWMLANVDRLVVEAPPGGVAAAVYERDDLLPYGVAGPLECKSRTWRSARQEDWGGEDPPDGPALQAYWYLAVTGYQRAWVAGSVDDDFVWFRLERDEELIGHLVQLVTEFWERHVLARVEPDPGDLESTSDLLGHLWDVRPDAVRFFTPDEVTEAETLLAQRRDAKERIKEAERDLTSAENALKLQLGPAEIALAPGQELYSWRRNGTFASKQFRDSEPDLAREYTHLVPAVDRDRLKVERPDTHAAYRARVFRTPGGPS